MKRSLRFLPLVWACLAIFWVGAAWQSGTQVITYAFGPESHLYLEGHTNVNEFSCSATADLPPQQALIQPLPEGFRVESTLKLAVRHLDCGHRLMNRDMWEALQADTHPYIAIKVREAYPQAPGQFLQQAAWSPARVTTDITIAGQKRTQVVSLEGRQIDRGKYELRGQLRLRLTDFGIEPPKAMLGMVAVKDEIVIHYDLVVLPQ